MTLELSTLFAIGVAYLFLLFAIAWLTDRNLIPSALASHPAVYTLSLGVFACGWSFFGMTAVAHDYGIGYIGYFIGAGALFLFAPLLLLPLIRICRRMQFTSLPDLLAYRYRGARVGAIATAAMLAAALPLVAVQIRIVSEVVARLSGASPTDATLSRLGLVFTTAVAIFAILFGARPISERERHSGLVVTMAFESLVKLAAVLTIGALALGSFGGPSGLEAWLEARPELVDALHSAIRTSSGHMLTIGFLAAAASMPHLFHMALYENPSMRAVLQAGWGFPLLLMLLSLPVLPVLWAGIRLRAEGGPEFFSVAIGIGLESPVIALAAFIGAVSAASSTIIVMTLAIASMTMNNFVLPFYRLGRRRDIYSGLEVLRSVLIALVIIAAWLFSVTIAKHASIEALGFASFVTAAQLFPGVLATFYWPAANRAGFLAGLGVGLAVCWTAVFAVHAGEHGAHVLALLPFQVPGNPWASAIINSLALNALALIAISWTTRQSSEEREAAATCSLDNLSGRGRHALQMQSPAQFAAGLARALGRAGAEREVARALRDLGYEDTESRPYAMRRLRDRIEANLSRLMGSSVAMELVNTNLPYAGTTPDGSGGDIHFVESRLEGFQHHLTGFAAELDALRRLYRDTLQELPIGVCGINASNEIVMWNLALQRTTGIAADNAIGSTLDSLPEPWNTLLVQFVASGELRALQQEIVANQQHVWISLYQAQADPSPSEPDARFVLVEDVTENQLLQQELFHSERLASIGRLAAGVAHEIGNPVTGIDCLAQNLLAESGEDGSRETAQQILRQTQRIGNILNTLVNFAHSGAGTRGAPERLALAQCADEAIYLLGLDRGARFVHFRNRCAPEATVAADGQKLLQVFVNLLSNARDASAPGGEVQIDTHLETDHVVVEITDAGSGVPAEHLEKIFDPFFTTKAPGQGTGLGLALVYTIVRDMQGEITITSPCDPARGRGTRVTIRLPAPRPEREDTAGLLENAPATRYG